jgi:putative ABC transport system permease protein
VQINWDDREDEIVGVVGDVKHAGLELAVAGVQTMEEVVSSSVAERRLTMLLLAAFADAALILAAVGIYGVMAYSVTQRTQEIGIRMALGAQRRDVLLMVVGHAALPAAVGIAAGAGGAFSLTRLIAGMLFQVAPADPATFLIVSAILAAVAILASSVPGLRATRVDPVIAMRGD